MGERLVETLIGAVVLIVAGAFFVYAYTRSTVRTTEGYELRAHFGSVGGLAVGSDVRISGIKVGTVTREELDPKTYLAIVHMNVASHVQIPDDSAVRIAQEGLLGGNYLSVEPGGSDDMLKPGAEITHTQGSVDLMSLVGQAIFSARGGGGGGGEGSAQAPAPGGQGGGFGAPAAPGSSNQNGAAGGFGAFPGLDDRASPADRPTTPAQAQSAVPPIPGSASTGEPASPAPGGDAGQGSVPGGTPPAPAPNSGP